MKSECCWRLVRSKSNNRRSTIQSKVLSPYPLSSCASPGVLWTCQSPAEVSRQRAQKPGRRSAHVRDAGCQRDPAGPGRQDTGDQMKNSRHSDNQRVVRRRGVWILKLRGHERRVCHGLHIHSLSRQNFMLSQLCNLKKYFLKGRSA